MSIKSTLKQFLLVRKGIRGFKKALAVIRGIGDEKVLAQLESIDNYHALAISEALSMVREKNKVTKPEAIKKIEFERARLSKLNKPLVDGSLGEPVEHDVDIMINQACFASKSYSQALLLYWLVKKIEPQNVLELGSNVGISSSYIGIALQANKNSSIFFTLDNSAYRLRIAKQVHKNVGLQKVRTVQGDFSNTLQSTLENMGSVDLAFIDGHHQYKPTLNYTNQIVKFASHNAILVYDDIRHSKEMKEAWDKLKNDERFGLVIDLYSVGICVLCTKKLTVEDRYVLPTLYNIF